MFASRKYIGGGSSQEGPPLFIIRRPGRILTLARTPEEKKGPLVVIAQSEQEKRILSLIDPIADAQGLEIVRVRIMGGRQPLLQIMTEKAGGAPTSVEHCKTLSKAVSVVFDDVDPITERYTLQVSTPGIDRPLTRIGDFERWKGQAAKLELIRPLEGRRKFQGVISGEKDGKVILQLDDETELEAEIGELAKASLILTDQLIEVARSAGTLPPQDDDLDGFEIDEQTSPTDEDDLQET